MRLWKNHFNSGLRIPVTNIGRLAVAITCMVLLNAHEYKYHYSNQRIKFVEMYFFCIYTVQCNEFMTVLNHTKFDTS